MLMRWLLPTPAILLLCLATLAAQAQTCPPGIDRVTPDAHLIDNGNSTITHSETGLMWKRCSEGQGGSNCTSGALSKFTWEGSLIAAELANVNRFAGYSDWRLPSVNELESIVETGCHSPSINGNRFPSTPSKQYWTSTPYSPERIRAWTIVFGTGEIVAYVKSEGVSALAPFYARLVRGGRSFESFDSFSSRCTLDIDGNGTLDALTDGLLIMRALFGLTGTAVTNGAIGTGTPTRATWANVRSYLNGSCGGSFSP